MSAGRSSPAPSYHSQSETGFAAFRSRNTRSRFSRFGQNNARDSEEHQGLLQDSDDDAVDGTTHGAVNRKRSGGMPRHSDDHRSQYESRGITSSIPSSSSASHIQIGSKRAGLIAALFSRDQTNIDLSRTISLGDSDRVRSKYPANVVSTLR